MFYIGSKIEILISSSKFNISYVYTQIVIDTNLKFLISLEHISLPDKLFDFTYVD